MSLLGLAAGGAGLSALGDITGGIAQANAAKYQAQVATNNATIEKQNAQYAASAGAANVERAGLQARSKLAGVRAGLAANNLDVNSGSPADIQVSQRETGQLDVQDVQQQAALQSYGYETQATSDTAQAGLLKTEAGYDEESGFAKGVSSFATNPSVDSLVSQQFPGSSSSNGSGDQTFAPGATGVPASLMSGPPSVPEAFQWMQDNNGTGEVY